MLGKIVFVGLFVLLAAIVVGSLIWSDFSTRGDDKYKYH